MTLGSLGSAGAVLRNSLKMEEAHFRSDLSGEEARELFQRHVELIEVETTSYCNRTCSFCPNSFIDRRSEKLVMPEATWQAIIAGLKDCAYDQTFIWSRYSEPLSEKRIIDRIKQVRQAAPNCRIAINTNGDYLDKDYLEELFHAGLNRLMVDIYMPEDEEYSDAMAQECLDRFLKRIDCSATVKSTYPELAAQVAHPMDTSANVRNLASLRRSSLADRGGLMQLAPRSPRLSPCYTPYKHLVVDWDGSVVVCCQVRSDSTEHKNAVIGQIGVNGLGLALAYSKLAEWRLSLKTYGPKSAPCTSCEFGAYPSTLVTRTLATSLSDVTSPLHRLLKIAFRPMLGKRSRW